jgi:hypothetical protein
MIEDLEEAPPSSGRGRFCVGQDAHGRWVVCDRVGTTGGIFADQASALRFARQESGNIPGAICCLPDGARLDIFAMLKSEDQPVEKAVRRAA